MWWAWTWKQEPEDLVVRLLTRKMWWTRNLGSRPLSRRKGVDLGPPALNSKSGDLGPGVVLYLNSDGTAQAGGITGFAGCGSGGRAWFGRLNFPASSYNAETAGLLESLTCASTMRTSIVPTPQVFGCLLAGVMHVAFRWADMRQYPL